MNLGNVNWKRFRRRLIMVVIVICIGLGITIVPIGIGSCIHETRVRSENQRLLEMRANAFEARAKDMKDVIKPDPEPYKCGLASSGISQKDWDVACENRHQALAKTKPDPAVGFPLPQTPETHVVPQPKPVYQPRVINDVGLGNLRENTVYLKDRYAGNCFIYMSFGSGSLMTNIPCDTLDKKEIPYQLF